MAKVKIIGEVNEESYIIFSGELDKALRNNIDEITIELSSTGGNQYIALAYYDKIRSCSEFGVKVIIQVFGPIFSAATLILSAGDDRIARLASYFYVHESGFEGVEASNTESVKREARNNIQFEWHWETLMSSRTKLSKEQWRKLSRRDTYFNSEKAYEYGLITHIIGG